MATGSLVVFIDGLDRVEIRNRGVVLDVVNTMLDSPLLGNLRMLVTVRDTGMVNKLMRVARQFKKKRLTISPTKRAAMSAARARLSLAI